MRCLSVCLRLPKAEFNAQNVSKIKEIEPDNSFSVEGTDLDSFAIVSSKKGLNIVECNPRNSNNQKS